MRLAVVAGFPGGGGALEVGGRVRHDYISADAKGFPRPSLLIPFH